MIRLCDIKDLQIGAADTFDTIISKGPLKNPYKVNKLQDHDYVCDRYEDWFKLQLELNNVTVVDELNRLKRVYRKHGILRLWCDCAPERCHGNTIVKWLVQECPDTKGGM